MNAGMIKCTNDDNHALPQSVRWAIYSCESDKSWKFNEAKVSDSSKSCIYHGAAGNKVLVKLLTLGPILILGRCHQS